MPTFFVSSDAITPPTIRISGPLLHHLRDSLRLQPGEPLFLTDDHGTRYRTEVTHVTPQAIEIRIVEAMPAPARTAPSVILAQALLKGEKMDWVIQKATELGVECIVPVHTKHGVVKIKPDRVEHQRSRWQKIALEAAQQSERRTVPTIAEPTDLARLFASYSSAASRGILSERTGGASLAAMPFPSDPDQSIILLVGPEGGWDREELLLAQERGYQSLTLGTRILRAETAAIAAISVLQSRLGELG
ncbi:MAG: 16S rRNA (uracil(1498)-N(3))-methyltransferase [Nitrospiraceae bacterium]